MSPEYILKDPSQISPRPPVLQNLIAANIAALVKRVGKPERLRPHVKTHKTRQIVRMERDAGISKQKCATIAEAEMVAPVRDSRYLAVVSDGRPQLRTVRASW